MSGRLPFCHSFVLVSPSSHLHTLCMCVRVCYGRACVSVVAKVPLNEACSASEECLSHLAQCVRGLCRCRDDYYDRQRACG